MNKNLTLPMVLLLLLLVSCTQQEEMTSPVAIDLKQIQTKQSEKDFDSAMKIVDQYPLFDGCDTKACSDEKLIQFIQDNLEYPDEARANMVEGRVFVQFVVEKDGSVSNAKVVKDIGGGTGEAALAVVQKMNDMKSTWSAGSHNGKTARVAFTLPITYRLES